MSKQDQGEDRLLDHSYDGIQEYDNPMPRWWLWIFYASIVFVPFYYLAPSPFGEGEGAVAQYEAEMARQAALQPPASSVAAVTDEQLNEGANDPVVLAEGRQVFSTNCAVCHRADGGGLIGPNLTDEAWIHGDSPTRLHATIVEGVLAKGMPGWGRILKPAQVDAVTAYVLSLKGTNPPSPKAPEGTTP